MVAQATTAGRGVSERWRLQTQQHASHHIQAHAQREQPTCATGAAKARVLANMLVDANAMRARGGNKTKARGDNGARKVTTLLCTAGARAGENLIDNNA